MEINYQTILEYLCSDETISSNFPTKKTIMVSSDSFPKVFKDHLESSKKTFYRYGITQYNKEQINISFLSSIFTLLDKKFITLDATEELAYINSFLNQTREKVREKAFKFELESRFSKDILIDRIDKLSLDDGILIQLFNQILDINLIIMDFKTEKINCIFNGDYMNPWKVTLLLAKSETNWEPLFADKKQFSFNDFFLKQILTNEEIIYFNDTYLDKAYSLLDNINQIDNYQKLTESDNDEVTDDTFINPANEIKSMGLNKTKLRNMKKDNIYELLEKLGLDVSKSTNKSNMINELLPYV